MTDTPVRAASPAKINWSLFVLGGRHDGFHEIRSLVSAVTLVDELSFRARPDATIELSCDDANLPTDDRNLIVRAGLLVRQVSGRPAGLSCRLTKRIPVGGGLGGGSSNAAAALKAVDRLWGLNWPVERLVDLAARLGSDVPFFVTCRSAVIAGRGERVTPARLGWRGWIVLLLPGIPVATASIYQAWRAPWPPVDIPDVASLAHHAAEARDAVTWMSTTCNMLEEPLVRLYPQIGDMMARAAELAGRCVRVSGSGSTLFTAFDTRTEARSAACRITDRMGIQTEVVQPVEQVREEASDHG